MVRSNGPQRKEEVAASILVASKACVRASPWLEGAGRRWLCNHGKSWSSGKRSKPTCKRKRCLKMDGRTRTSIGKMQFAAVKRLVENMQQKKKLADRVSVFGDQLLRYKAPSDLAPSAAQSQKVKDFRKRRAPRRAVYAAKKRGEDPYVDERSGIVVAQAKAKMKEAQRQSVFKADRKNNFFKLSIVDHPTGFLEECKAAIAAGTVRNVCLATSVQQSDDVVVKSMEYTGQYKKHTSGLIGNLSVAAARLFGLYVIEWGWFKNGRPDPAANAPKQILKFNGMKQFRQPRFFCFEDESKTTKSYKPIVEVLEHVEGTTRKLQIVDDATYASKMKRPSTRRASFKVGTLNGFYKAIEQCSSLDRARSATGLFC